ncbi:MAG TPA: DnaA/Hda family protein [Ktedonosporobacter sp.]|nr:DnaA/Hda family protein [Ktedonosporobacter sp.]
MLKLKHGDIPKCLKARMSQDPQEKTWECPTCGVIEPGMLVEGWYYRRCCPCQERARMRAPQQEAPRTLQQALARNQVMQTYTWLGRKWHLEGLEKKTFASFEEVRQPDAFDQALQFAKKPAGTLLLYGSFGLGKTHLLAAIANQHIAEGKPCLFASAVTLFDAIVERISADEEYHDLLKRAMTTPLLLLDDIDKPKISEFRKEMYYQIIDGRTRAGRPLVVSANCSLTELECYVGGATKSRLMMGLVPVQMEGADYRAGMLR